MNNILEEYNKNPKKYTLTKEEKKLLYSSHSKNVGPELEKNAKARARSWRALWRL